MEFRGWCRMGWLKVCIPDFTWEGRGMLCRLVGASYCCLMVAFLGSGVDFKFNGDCDVVFWSYYGDACIRAGTHDDLVLVRGRHRRCFRVRRWW